MNWLHIHFRGMPTSEHENMPSPCQQPHTSPCTSTLTHHAHIHHTLNITHTHSTTRGSLHTHTKSTNTPLDTHTHAHTHTHTHTHIHTHTHTKVKPLSCSIQWVGFTFLLHPMEGSLSRTPWKGLSQHNHTIFTSYHKPTETHGSNQPQSIAHYTLARALHTHMHTHTHAHVHM